MKTKYHGYFHYIGAKILIAGASLCGAFVGLGGAVYHIARLDVKKASLSLGATLTSLVNTAAQTVKAVAGVLGAGHFVKEKDSLKQSCTHVLTGYNWVFIEYGSDETTKNLKEHYPHETCIAKIALFIAKTALFEHYFKFIVNGSTPTQMLEEDNSIDDDWKILNKENSGSEGDPLFRVESFYTPKAWNLE